MSRLTLTLSERRVLEKQIQQTKDVKVFKRAQALLWLTDGISVQEASKRLGVTRQTIYDWVSFFSNQCGMSVIDRLHDRPKSGRQPRKSQVVLQELDTLLNESPRQHGYLHAEWTSTLLKQALQREHDLDVSTRTIRHCLKQLHHVWKRPTYSLARQSPTWRQEKGGLKKVSSITQD